MLDAIGLVFGLIAIVLYLLADQSTLLWITSGRVDTSHLSDCS